MKSAILGLLMIGFSVTSLASARLVTIEEQIVNKSCQAPENKEIASLCKQLTVRNERAVESRKVEARLYSVMKAEIAKDQGILNYGGLNDLDVTCNSQVKNVFFCHVQGRAGDSEGLYIVNIQLLVEQQADGSLKRTVLSKSGQGID